MEIELRAQLIALLLAIAIGFAIGLIYDIMRPMRYHFNRAGGILLDALFCLAAGAAMFVFAMGADNGRLGVWEIAAAGVGFVIYINLLSPPILGFLNRLWLIFVKMLGTVKKILKKTAECMKFIFKKTKECFIIKK